MTQNLNGFAWRTSWRGMKRKSVEMMLQQFDIGLVDGGEQATKQQQQQQQQDQDQKIVIPIWRPQHFANSISDLNIVWRHPILFSLFSFSLFWIPIRDYLAIRSSCELCKQNIEIA